VSQHTHSARMEGLRTPMTSPAGVQPQLFSQPAASQALFPQGAVTPGRQPQANITPVSSSPKRVLQQGPEMPQIVLPRTMDNPLKAALSDGANGALLVDAVTAECGHTFGSASLQKVLAMVSLHQWLSTLAYTLFQEKAL
jgi:hypothetical protein